MSIAAGFELADGVFEESEGEAFLKVEKFTVRDKPLADTVRALQRFRGSYLRYPHDQITPAFGAIENHGGIALFL